MMYFDCLVIGTWAFAFGWFLGAIYVQNQNEKPTSLRSAGGSEPAALVEIPLHAVGSAAAAD